MEPITILVLLLIVTVALLLGYIITEKRKRENIEERLLRTMFDHEKIFFKGQLLSKNEQRFYHDLQKAFSDKYQVFPLMSLNALLNIKDEKEKHPNLGKFYFDFVLCTKDSYQPVIAIELNDKIHSRQQRKQRDAYFLSALHTANIRYLSCESNYLTYDHYIEDIKKLLSAGS